MTSIVKNEIANALAPEEIVDDLSKFTRATIEKLGNRVSMTDKDDATGLELYCYVNCEPEEDSIINQCRGVVFHGQDIIMHAFPYTVEFSHTDQDSINKTINPIFDQCTVFDAYEGALIRMFHFSNKWFTCTHRKLNAFRSKWSSKESFGTTFKRALESEVENNETLRNSIPAGDEGLLERFQNTLDPTKQYMFLVLHNDENRIVCSAPKRPTLFHVGTFLNKELLLNEQINIPYPTRHTFSNTTQLVEYVNSVDICHKQGVIIFAPNNKQYKVLHNDYIQYFKVRGNEPSIKYRYLQVRMNPEIVDNLYHLYPDSINVFEEYENAIYAIAQNIYSSYVSRYIKKKWVTVAVDEYNVIRKCHAFHEANRKTNRISLEKVIQVLNEQSPTNLNKMIRRFQNEKDRSSNENNENKEKTQYLKHLPTDQPSVN